MNKNGSRIRRKLPWVQGLNDTISYALRPDDLEISQTFVDIEEELQESIDDPDPDAIPLAFEEYERQCYDELILIHRDALEYPMTDQAYARAKAIVAEWKQKKIEHELPDTEA